MKEMFLQSGLTGAGRVNAGDGVTGPDGEQRSGFWPHMVNGCVSYADVAVETTHCFWDGCI